MTFIKKIIKYLLRHFRIAKGYLLLIPRLFIKNNSPILIILGMHRSGTSCITRMFNLSGVSLGTDLFPPAKDNSEGYWEDARFVRINNKILKNSNGSWYNPPKNLKVSLKNKLDIMSFIYNRGNLIIGLKDPRMLLTWEAWKPYLKNYEIVGVFRHPSSVAKSLSNLKNIDMSRKKRYGIIDENYGNELWHHYNKNLLNISKKEQVTFINFDNNETFHLKIKNVIEKLNLKFDSDALKFYNPSNRNSDSENKIIDANNINTYNQLLKNE